MTRRSGDDVEGITNSFHIDSHASMRKVCGESGGAAAWWNSDDFLQLQLTGSIPLRSLRGPTLISGLPTSRLTDAGIPQHHSAGKRSSAAHAVAIGKFEPPEQKAT